MSFSSWRRRRAARRAAKNQDSKKSIHDCYVNQSRSSVTEKIPITPHEVSEILSKLDDAKNRHDENECQELVSKIKASAKEIEKNNRMVVFNGTGRVLSAAFEAFSKRDMVENRVTLLEQILSALTIIALPFDEETRFNLSTSQSLNSIVLILRYGTLPGRRNGAVALRMILSSDQNKVDELAKIEGSLEVLVNLIKDPICPTTTKATLLAMYHMVTITSSESKLMIIEKFVEMGLVQMLLEMVLDSDRSVIERAFGVLDGICSYSEGRKKVYENALIVPILVKKLLLVSELATIFSVSILWKLGKYEDEDEVGGRGVIVEALELGVFQKLLLLLQIGCNEEVKEKVTYLLKLLNAYREKVEYCIDSLDFKDLKRPF